jgi:putative tricarboxylic transport membrane protein
MNGLEYAFAAIASPWSLLAAFGGVAWGMLGGALPGISPSIAMALLLPFTYGMDALTSLILLGSVYVGAEYGGSIPAILIRTPGTNSAAATTIDGYAMHKQGRGGEALGLSLVSGVIGGLFGLVMLVLLAAPLSRLALVFTPPAYFSLGVLGLSVIASLSSGSLVKGLIAAVFGLMIATVGTDPVSGVSRFTFGESDLLGGIDFILVMVGVFAMTELFVQAGLPDWDKTQARDTHIKLPSWAMMKRIRVAHIVGLVLGTIEGIMPGAGGTVASFMSYNEAKRWSKHPEEFGKGSPEGIAAPECANNVVASTALIPTLTFGIPGSNSTAVLLGGLLLHGLEPGPLLLSKNPDVVYGLFGGLFVANIAQLLIGILIMTPAIWLVNRPKPYLLAVIYVLIFSGIFTINHSMFDLGLVMAAGVLGYFMRFFGFPFLPLILAVVLGYLIESNYRRALVVGNDSNMIFLTDPASLVLLILAAVFIATSLARTVRDQRRAAAATPPERPK